EIGPGAAQAPADLDAIEPRQHQVEHDEVVRRSRSLLDRQAPVVDGLDLVPGALQEVDESLAKDELVFDDEDPHAQQWLSLVNDRAGAALRGSKACKKGRTAAAGCLTRLGSVPAVPQQVRVAQALLQLFEVGADGLPEDRHGPALVIR